MTRTAISTAVRSSPSPQSRVLPSDPSNVDDLAAQGGSACGGVAATGQGCRGAQQVVGLWRRTTPRPSWRRNALRACGPPHPPTTATRPTPTQPLALGAGMACTVAQHHRALTATVHHSLTTRRKARPENTGKLGNQQITPAQNPKSRSTARRRTNSSSSVDRGLALDTRSGATGASRLLRRWAVEVW
jgi:hypothetical protein